MFVLFGLSLLQPMQRARASTNKDVLNGQECHEVRENRGGCALYIERCFRLFGPTGVGSMDLWEIEVGYALYDTTWLANYDKFPKGALASMRYEEHGGGRGQLGRLGQGLARYLISILVRGVIFLR